MSDSNKLEEIGASILFNSWAADIRQLDPLERYEKAQRREHISRLMRVFIKYKVSFDEANMFRRRIVEVIVSKEGMKGKGRHKNWPENTLSDFDLLIAEYYGIDLEANEVQPKALTLSTTQYEEDEAVRDWVLGNYGNNSNIMAQAHTIGSIYNLRFLDEYF